jgi:integrase
MGSVYSYTLKGGRKKWGFALYLPETVGGGKRQQLRREGFDRKLDAEAAMAEEDHGVRVGTAPSLEERRLTTGQWADRWLAGLADIRPSTERGYGIMIRAYIKPAIGHIPLAALRPDHLSEMMTKIRTGEVRPQTSRRRDGGQLSAQSVRQIYSVTQAMLAAAVEQRRIPWSPAVGVRLPKVKRRDPATWSEEQAATFLAFAEEHEPRLALGYRIALSYGLRRGEIAGLRWCDIDTEGDRLHVRQQTLAVGGELLLGQPPKTDRGERSIPLSSAPGFAAALREHRKRQLQDRMAAGPAWQETGLVLATEHGGPVPPWVLSDRFTALVKRSGLPAIVLHECRHSANSAWARLGVETLVRQKWMGHSDAKMTDQTYLDITAGDHDRAARLAATGRVSSGLL